MKKGFTADEKRNHTPPPPPPNDSFAFLLPPRLLHMTLSLAASCKQLHRGKEKVTCQKKETKEVALNTVAAKTVRSPL